MTKLLVRDDWCLVPGEVEPAYDWLNPLRIALEIANGWFSGQTIVGTDRYTLDVEHERLNRVDWHDLAQQHPIEPTSTSDDIVIGD